MTEHKFTDEEVINSLKICANNGECKECAINPHKGNYGFCTGLAINAALDLINRQKAEIKKLKDLNSQLETDIINANMNLEHITYEFDLLKQEKSVVVAEAVKEFAERLKIYYRNLDKTVGALINYTIDQKLKEFLGERGGKENG